MADSFLFYRDYWGAMERLPKEKQIQFLKGIVMYGFGDSEKLESDDPLVDMAYMFCRSLLNANRKKREAAAKGGKSKRGKYHASTMLQPNVNVNDNVNANDNENWNVNDNDNSNVNGNENGNLKGSLAASDSLWPGGPLSDELRAQGWTIGGE